MCVVLGPIPLPVWGGPVVSGCWPAMPAGPAGARLEHLGMGPRHLCKSMHVPISFNVVSATLGVICLHLNMPP